MGRASWIFGLGISISLALVASAYAAPPLDYQDPPSDPPGAGLVSQLGPGQTKAEVPERLNGIGNFQNLPAQDESGFIVVAVRKEPLWKAGVLDPVLTNACRLGYFVSVPLNRMVVQFEAPGEGEGGRGALQYIPPDRRHLLVDVRHLAAPGEIYYFKDATSPACQVWVENLQAPRRLNAGGTSLAPRDPRAVAKVKAMVKSWPQKPEAPTAP